jgi:carboxyl-terminal processing protease
MKKQLTLLSVVLGLFWSSSLANASYTDVPDDSPYKEGVDYLELLGALDDSDTFRPTANLTKAEFYKILFTVFQDEVPSGKTTFADVPTDAWFAPYAHLAQNNGLEEENTFGPMQKLNKIDAMKKLLTAYGVAGGIIPWSYRTTLFSDVPSVHPYYSVIARLVNEGILIADPETPLDPFKKLTRGDFANLLLDFEKWQMYKQEVAASDFYKSDIFANIWNQIMENYYLPSDQAINPDALFNAAVKGMLDSLGDPFTTYFTPDQSNEFSNTLSGSFEGIGAYVNQDENTGEFFFSGFVPDSPAANSGLEEDDVILAIDGISTSTMSIEEVISRIKGADQTEVTITVKRGEETYNYNIIRSSIQITTVSGKTIDKSIWYIDIDIFGSSTGTDYLNTIRELKTSVPEPKAIILDLRSNGGGYINTANQIAGDYMHQYTTVVTLDYGDYSQDIVNASEGIYADLPLYILVNEKTASASEILTQDLKEESGAIVIGTQTYGKGSAQTLTQYWDGSELKITIAHWLSSHGTSINGVGVTPDITIQSDAEAGVDPWLQAAEKLIDKL